MAEHFLTVQRFSFCYCYSRHPNPPFMAFRKQYNSLYTQNKPLHRSHTKKFKLIPGTWTPYTLASSTKSIIVTMSETSVVATFSPFHLLKKMQKNKVLCNWLWFHLTWFAEYSSVRKHFQAGLLDWVHDIWADLTHINRDVHWVATPVCGRLARIVCHF